MRTKFTNLLVVGVAGATLLLGACTDEYIADPFVDPTPTSTPVVQPPSVPTTSNNTITVPVVDSKTGAPLNGTMTVVNGSTILSKRIQLKADRTVPITNGSALLELKNGLTLPQRFTVNIKANGYVETARTLNITKTGDLVLSPFKLTSVSAPPTGVKTQSDSVTLSGAANQNVVVESEVTGSGLSAGKVTVTIPTDVQVRDANNQPIANPGAISLETTVFTIGNTESLDSFPGGLESAVLENAADLIQNNPDLASNSGIGQGEDEVVFESAGFTAVKMRAADGTEIKNFDKPIKVRLDVADGVFNPDTGANVKCGDVIPVWSFEETTGVWKYEGDGTVQQVNNAGCANASATGKLFIEQETTHLTYFNLDYVRGAAQRCGTTSINVVDSNGSAYGGGSIASISVPSRGFSGTSYAGAAAVLSFLNTPSSSGDRGMRFNVTLKDATTNEVLPIVNISGGSIATTRQATNGSLVGVDLCGRDGGTIRINKVNPVTAGVRVRAEAFCSNTPSTPNVTPLPGVRTYILGPAYEVAKTNAQGLVTISTQGNRSGIVYALNPYTNRYENKTVSIGAANSIVEVGFRFGQTCQVITGGQGGTN